MSDFRARAEHVDQIDEWSLDPSAANSELQQQNDSKQVPKRLFKNSTTTTGEGYKLVCSFANWLCAIGQVTLGYGVCFPNLYSEGMRLVPRQKTGAGLLPLS